MIHLLKIPLIYFCISTLSATAFAQEKLLDIDFIKRNSIPINRMIDDIIIIKMTPKLKLGNLVVAVRFYEDNLEIIARGQIANIQNNEFQATLERETIVKLPTEKDFIITVSDLSGTPPEPAFTSPQDSIITDEPNPYEPGYIDITNNQTNGKLTTTPSEQTNSFKKYSYKFNEKKLLWYFDFLWRIGLEISNFKGSIPVKSYNRVESEANLEEYKIGIHYRMTPVWRELRPTLKLSSKTLEFTTLNTDEYIISSAYSMTGFGVIWRYNFSENIPTPKHNFKYYPNQLYLDLDYYLASVKDKGVSRGKGTGSQIELKLGYQSLISTNKIPWINRYLLTLESGQIISNYSFKGSTKSAIDGYYQIPAGSTSKETETFIKLSLGLRFDDFISKVIKGRE